MLRRLILTFALALLFGLGQQGVVVHEISHYADINPSSQQQDKSAHTSLCEKCLSYSGLASAVGVGHYTPPAATGDFAAVSHPGCSHPSHTPGAYSARAPPLLA